MRTKKKIYTIIDRKTGKTEKFTELRDALRSKEGNPYKVFIEAHNVAKEAQTEAK